MGCEATWSEELKPRIFMPRKPKFGQNFLVDPSASRAIVDALGDLSDREVLEIGPGQGVITELLAARARRLIAVEIDHDLALQLRVHFERTPKVEAYVEDDIENLVESSGAADLESNVQIIEADFLQLDLSTVPQAAGGKLAVVGNLPYYITSDILLRLF